ncbi:MAG: STT3 domain-containing protein, partial [Candidatus Freyarchaeota archaeon]
MSHSLLMEASILLLILLIAFTVRFLPSRWGFHLSEFDPYFHYRLADYIEKNGFFAWRDWHDYQRWYPWGIDVGKAAFPGLALSAAFIYKILEVLGVPISLYDFCVVFPVFMGTLTVLMLYFLGRYIGGKGVGLFSALFLALSASHIGRTSLGFFDDETVGMFSILLISYTFLKAIEKHESLRPNLVYSVISGLALGYLIASWGTSLYLINLLTLFTFV